MQLLTMNFRSVSAILYSPLHPLYSITLRFQQKTYNSKEIQVLIDNTQRCGALKKNT